MRFIMCFQFDLCLKTERLTSVLRHCGFRFNLIFILHQFNFVITGKFSACLTTTDVKHSNVMRNHQHSCKKKAFVDIPQKDF